ncbi:hypothetical protein [Streptomyces mirabilis]|uniref:Isochorismatase family protein n=1 Tax=Streptomyces mirabilis TaxID=68239 RepID=A0ABU3V539_9ACTN|nr:hypothetical protein [Streptomyces mirabilis]MCX5355638.1 hypothetical protein [Streptomyces mirabilis]MDU9001284.1 hypothetical protein [Streptomyces mirabilis]
MPVLQAEETALVMIDHAVGFGNLFRSHHVAEHVNNTVALAKTVLVYDLPLVVTNGADTSPSGPLFGQFKQVLGDTEVVVRQATSMPSPPNASRRPSPRPAAGSCCCRV